MSRFTIYLPVLIILTSCGERQGADGSGAPDFPAADDPTGVAAIYEWDDPECQGTGRTGSRLDYAWLTNWDKAKPEDKRVELAGLVNAHGKVEPSQVTGNVTVFSEYTRTCGRTKTGKCLNSSGDPLGFTGYKLGATPRFCGSAGKYKRDSIERVTLSSSFSLRQAKLFLESKLLTPNALRGVELKILPKVQTIWPSTSVGADSTRQVSVNNVSYFPSGSSGQQAFIAVMPRDKDDGEEVPRLWESPFVIAHELGHHVEHLLGVDHFGTSKRTLTRAAISEAFADLLAFSALGLNDRALFNIPCLDGRAVSEENFSNGQTKRIDKLLVAALKHREKAAAQPQSFQGFLGNGNCPLPNHVEPHGLGAILAHIIYSHISQAMAIAKVETKNEPEVLAKYTKFWLLAADEAMRSGAGAESDIPKAALALEKSVTRLLADYKVTLENNVATVLCQRMNFHFSGVQQKTWFGQSCAAE